MNADGTHNRLIKTPAIDVQAPAWSPDSQWIAFGTTHPGLHRYSDIYLIRPNGNDLHAITHQGAGGLGPAWSPDGRKIAFVSYRDGNDEIYVMNADGSNQRNLTNSPDTQDFNPVWPPPRR